MVTYRKKGNIEKNNMKIWAEVAFYTIEYNPKNISISRFGHINETKGICKGQKPQFLMVLK